MITTHAGSNRARLLGENTPGHHPTEGCGRPRPHRTKPDQLPAFLSVPTTTAIRSRIQYCAVRARRPHPSVGPSVARRKCVSPFTSPRGVGALARTAQNQISFPPGVSLLRQPGYSESDSVQRRAGEAPAPLGRISRPLDSGVQSRLSCGDSQGGRPRRPTQALEWSQMRIGSKYERSSIIFTKPEVNHEHE